MVSQSLLIISVADTIECKPDHLSWRHGRASPLPASLLRGKVVMESLGKDIRCDVHADGASQGPFQMDGGAGPSPCRIQWVWWEVRVTVKLLLPTALLESPRPLATKCNF